MTLTLLEVKEKINDPLKKLLDIDDFRIVFAERRKDLSGDVPWLLGINFTQKVTSSKTKEVVDLPSSVVVTVDAETGEITAVSNVTPISRVKMK